MGKLLDLTGKTLGNRTAIKRVPSAGQTCWVFRCRGTVGLDGRITFFQKPHGGMDFVAQALNTLGVRYTRRQHKTRNLEELYVLKEDIEIFKKYVQPKFPKKFGRLFGLQKEEKKE